MTLTLRAKLFAIVGISAAGFLLPIVVSQRLTQRELSRIEAVYLPKIKLRATLGALLEDVSRACQDAVRARDPQGLASAREAKERFLEHVDESAEAIDGVRAAALRQAMEDYFASADDTSRRLIAGESGEPLVLATSSMQSKQERALVLLDRAAGFDPRELHDAFAAASSAQRKDLRIRMAVIFTCLSSVVLLSLWLSRGLLRSIRDLAHGLDRFGRGELDRPILVTSADELGVVAEQANKMAAALRRSVADLEAFNYSVSHDLRAPLRPLDGFSQALLEDYGDILDPKAKDYLKRIRAAAQRMSQLIEDMLQFSRLGRGDLNNRAFDLAPLGEAVVAELRRTEPGRDVEFVSIPEATTYGDSRLMRIVLENLLRNAWKFSRKTERARIELGAKDEAGRVVYFVSDNGAGFDLQYAKKLFQPFQRLHTGAEFEGTGIGLAIVQRIIHRHDGRVWAEAAPGKGATFFFTLHDGKAPT